MSFFSRLSELIGEEYSVQITIQKKGGNLSVSVVPKALEAKDKAGKTIVPIVVTGTPDQIDAGLISAIAQPVASLNQLVVSGQAFVKEEKKTTTKKDEPVKKEESPQQTLKPVTPVVAKSETAKKPEVEEVKTTSTDPALAETFDEDTGEIMPVSEMMDEEPTAAEASDTDQEDPSQKAMFDDEDWA